MYWNSRTDEVNLMTKWQTVRVKERVGKLSNWATIWPNTWLTEQMAYWLKDQLINSKPSQRNGEQMTKSHID